MPRPADPRRDRLWRMHDFAQGHGLEIGPLHRATVQRDEAAVQYVDVFPAEHLREVYASHAAIATERIPEIDIVLLQDGVVRRLADATAAGAPYDWIVASHVVEHVPDLVDWLGQLAEITRDDGALLLVVPDRRYTFDLHRPFTSVGQILQAHELAEDRPSVRAVYDHFRSHVTVPAARLWAGDPPPGDAARSFGLAEALAQVERRRAGEYVDAHVWVFTPHTFLEQLAELRRLGLSSWYVDTVEPTTRNTLEFLVRLRRIPRGVDATIDPHGEVLPGDQGPDWVTDQHGAAQEVQHLRERVRRQRRRIRAMEASRRWRWGGAVQGPVEALERAAHRLRLRRRPG